MRHCETRSRSSSNAASVPDSAQPPPAKESFFFACAVPRQVVWYSPEINGGIKRISPSREKDIKKGKKEMEKEEKPGRGWKTGGNMMGRYSKEKWAEVKTSFFKDGIFKIRDLERIHGINKATIGRKITKEKWREELDREIRQRDLKEFLDSEKGERAIEEAIESKKGEIVRRLLDSTTKLLERVQTRVRELKVADGAEMASLVGSLKQLQGMLEGLMGSLREEAVEERKIDVRILGRVIEVSDEEKEREAKLRDLAEAKRRVEERRLVKEISDIKKAGTEDVVKGVDRDER